MLIGAVGGASPCTSLRSMRRAAALERDAAAEARNGAVPVGTRLTCLATGRSVGRGTGLGWGPAVEPVRPEAGERPEPASGTGTFFGLMIGSIPACGVMGDMDSWSGSLSCTPTPFCVIATVTAASLIPVKSLHTDTGRTLPKRQRAASPLADFSAHDVEAELPRSAHHRVSYGSGVH